MFTPASLIAVAISASEPGVFSMSMSRSIASATISLLAPWRLGLPLELAI
jgi:hypothetical protein